MGGPVDIRRALSRGEVMRICSAPRREGTRRFYYGDLLLQLSGRYGDGRRRVHVAADARIAPGLEAKKTRGRRGSSPSAAPSCRGLSKKGTSEKGRRSGRGGRFSPGDKVDNARLQNRSLTAACSQPASQRFRLCVLCY